MMDLFVSEPTRRQQLLNRSGKKENITKDEGAKEVKNNCSVRSARDDVKTIQNDRVGVQERMKYISTNDACSF